MKIRLAILLTWFVLFAVAVSAAIKDKHDTTCLTAALTEEINHVIGLCDRQSISNEDVYQQINTIDSNIRYYIERYHDHTTNTLETIGMLITLLVALVGIVIPLILTRKREVEVDDKLQTVEDLLKKTQSLENNIKLIQKTVKKERQRISEIQATIQEDKAASEEAAKQAKISELLSQSYNEKDPQTSIEYLDSALKLDSNNYVAYYKRGVNKSNLGDKNGAIEDYTKAIELNPNNDRYYTSRAKCLRKIAKTKRNPDRQDELLKKAEADDAKANELKMNKD